MADPDSDIDERQLVERILDGDREELCQDVFVRAYRYLDGFRFESKLSTWLARIARNTCLNHLEKKDMPLYADEAPSPEGETPDARTALDRVPDADADVAEATVDRQRREVVRESIDALSERYRTALTLYHLEGMGASQIGEVMDNPEGTVKSHLYRSRKKLKDWLLDRYQREEITL